MVHRRKWIKSENDSHMTPEGIVTFWEESEDGTMIRRKRESMTTGKSYYEYFRKNKYTFVRK